MKRFCLLLIYLFLNTITSFALSPAKYISKDSIPQTDSIKVGGYLIKVIAVTNGFGYDIYNNKKLFIHQTTIPAVAGNSGFATKTAAEKVARKVVEKLGKGEQLPTVSIDEIKALGALP